MLEVLTAVGLATSLISFLLAVFGERITVFWLSYRDSLILKSRAPAADKRRESEHSKELFTRKVMELRLHYAELSTIYQASSSGNKLDREEIEKLLSAIGRLQGDLVEAKKISVTSGKGTAPTTA
jgi:hypothetical protein